MAERERAMLEAAGSVPAVRSNQELVISNQKVGATGSDY